MTYTRVSDVYSLIAPLIFFMEPLCWDRLFSELISVCKHTKNRAPILAPSSHIHQAPNINLRQAITNMIIFRLSLLYEPMPSPKKTLYYVNAERRKL